VVDCRYLLTILPLLLSWLHPHPFLLRILTSPVPFSGSNSTWREDAKIKLKIGSFLASHSIHCAVFPILLVYNIFYFFPVYFILYQPFSGEALMVNFLSFLRFLFFPLFSIPAESRPTQASVFTTFAVHPILSCAFFIILLDPNPS
jgi:hypothetical protein